MTEPLPYRISDEWCVTHPQDTPQNRRNAEVLLYRAGALAVLHRSRYRVQTDSMLLESIAYMPLERSERYVDQAPCFFCGNVGSKNGITATPVEGVRDDLSANGRELLSALEQWPKPVEAA